MATAQSDVATAREPVPPQSLRRPLTARLSTGHVVLLLAALLAGLANFAVLRAGDDAVRIAVAATDLRAGVALDAGAVAYADVIADDALLAGLLQPDDVAALTGHLTTTTVAAGAPIRRGDLLAPSATDGRRAMSIPVEPEHAVGGDLAVGDRVDVIEVRDGAARYLVTGAEVLAVPAAEARGALGGLRAFSVTIAVDETEALRLAAAIRGGGIELIRSTGAPPVAVHALPAPPGEG